MKIETLTVGAFGSNCFIIQNDRDEALVVDPGDESERIIGYIGSRRLKVAAYLITHGHIDHVSALADAVKAFPAPVAMHPVDIAWAFSPSNQMPPYYGVPEQPPQIARELAEGQEWTDIGFRYTVMELPGHSPGHVGFYFPEEAVLFSGDVLFQGSVGRTDLPGGDGRILTQTLKRLATLPDETLVYCGHGDHTTIGDEKRHNPYIQYFTKRGS